MGDLPRSQENVDEGREMSQPYTGIPREAQNPLQTESWQLSLSIALSLSILAWRGLASFLVSLYLEQNWPEKHRAKPYCVGGITPANPTSAISYAKNIS